MVSPEPRHLGLPGSSRGSSPRPAPLSRPTHTAEYPDVAPDLPPRSRGVIALLEENCTSCMLCARECPDWCIYIDSHKETIPATTEGGRERQRNVLDRFAIDFCLCMYCGICIEVCPFDALHWSPQFEYAEIDIRDLLHEKERLGEWMADRAAAARPRRGVRRAGRDRRGRSRPAAPACGGAGCASARLPRTARAAKAADAGDRPNPRPRPDRRPRPNRSATGGARDRRGGVVTALDIVFAVIGARRRRRVASSP